ncbi:hypothetical protein B0I35DRAFT_409076 [Stachybotrys elegans]|uniref:Corticosteroid-binding protein n=1 Tax=Stachybotrys elegans TaxID=80388 RepID=A0A8K0SVV1_9HYPO|nr:hypothetical protein B0I35DRAFT_409076 [Stachybotrys elegans]
MFSPGARRWRAPVHAVTLPYLMVLPVVLALVTIVALFFHSDVNVAMMWSQCHSHARIPQLSRIPIIGTPLCGLTSFFHAALDSHRTTALMAVILAYVGALSTVCTLESARPCNAPSRLIRNPTPAWLLFNLVGGAAVWQLIIVPAFLLRAKHHMVADPQLPTANSAATATASGTHPADHHDAHYQVRDRSIPDAEAIAIPVAVTLGYFLPSILMLAFNSYVTILLWLFFPLYVSAIRHIICYAIGKLRTSEPRTVHPEDTPPTLAFFYATPVLLSVLAHVFVIWNLTTPDDRAEMTRSTIKFIEIDFLFIAATVLYWVLVEVGWEVPLIMLGSSIAVGPGAGICLGWLLREKAMLNELEPEPITGHVPHRSDEQTPLLQS